MLHYFACASHQHSIFFRLQVFFNGGILSNDASTPVNGSALEVLDLRTLSPYVVQVRWAGKLLQPGSVLQFQVQMGLPLRDLSVLLAFLLSIAVTSLPCCVTLQVEDNANLTSSRYRHQLVTWNDKILAVGGQYDDSYGASQHVINVIALDLNTRQWSLLKEFSQPGGRGEWLEWLGSAVEACACSDT